MCHAMDEEDWFEVIMPSTKGELSSSSGDHQENLKPDACDGGDTDCLEEHGEKITNSNCTATQSDEASPDCSDAVTSSAPEPELILCPNRCGVQMLAEDIEDHIRQTCRRAIVKCEFAGCSVELPRAEMQYHYRNELPMHLLMLSKNVTTLLSKMEAIENHLKPATTASSAGTRKERRRHQQAVPSAGSKQNEHVDASAAAGTAQKDSSGGFMSIFRDIFTKKSTMETNSAADRKCEICRTVFKTSSNAAGLEESSICPR